MQVNVKIWGNSNAILKMIFLVKLKAGNYVSFIILFTKKLQHLMKTVSERRILNDIWIEIF